MGRQPTRLRVRTLDGGWEGRGGGGESFMAGTERKAKCDRVRSGWPPRHAHRNESALPGAGAGFEPFYLGKEIGDSGNYFFLLGAGQFGEDRQRQGFARRCFGGGKISLPVAQRLKTLLLVQRQGVVDGATDALRAEVRAQGVAVLGRHPDDVLMIDVVVGQPPGRRKARRVGEPAPSVRLRRKARGTRRRAPAGRQTRQAGAPTSPKARRLGGRPGGSCRRRNGGNTASPSRASGSP